MFERYSEKAKQTILSAKRVAGQHGSREINTGHILLSLLEDEDLISRITNICSVKLTLEEIVARLNPSNTALAPSDLPLSSESRQVLILAEKEADTFAVQNIENEHVLLGLLQVPRSDAARLLKQKGLTADAIRADMLLRSKIVPKKEGSPHFAPSAHGYPLEPNQKKVILRVSELMKRGKHRKALKLLDEYMAEPAEDHTLRIQAHSLLASVLARNLGDLERARHYCQQAVAYSPDDPTALYALADCFALQGQTKEARTWALKCYESSTKRGDVVGRGMVELLEKRFPELRPGS